MRKAPIAEVVRRVQAAVKVPTTDIDEKPLFEQGAPEQHPAQHVLATDQADLGNDVTVGDPDHRAHEDPLLGPSQAGTNPATARDRSFDHDPGLGVVSIGDRLEPHPVARKLLFDMPVDFEADRFAVSLDRLSEALGERPLSPDAMTFRISEAGVRDAELATWLERVCDAGCPD